MREYVAGVRVKCGAYTRRVRDLGIQQIEPPPWSL